MFLQDVLQKILHKSGSTTGGSAPVVTSTGGPIKGLDIYHGDSVVSFESMLAGLFHFIFIKASEGLSSDPMFSSHFAGAKAAGLIPGPYHFFRGSLDPEAQAEHFSQIIRGAGLAESDLPPVMDWEYANGNPVASDVPKARAFLEKVQSLTGRLPIIYTSNALPGELGNPLWIKNYPLWTAEYGVSKPRVGGWTFWQYSESESIPGLGNKGDANVFAGSLDDLKTFISKT